MEVYETTINHDGWCETFLVKTLAEAKDNSDGFRKVDLVDWLMDILDSRNDQVDRDWLVDNLKEVLG